MRIISSAMLINSGVYLALGFIYVRFWWAERTRTAYLAFAVACVSYMLFSWFELGMLTAATPEEYLFYSWWAVLPGTVGLVAVAWFGYVHLQGRKWLFVTYSAMRILALVIHLFMANGILFREITSIGRRTILGETLSYPISAPNPWMLLPHLSHVVLVVFFLDASVRCWRRGERRQALSFGTGTILFGTTVLVFAPSVLWGLVHIPIMASFTVLFFIVAMLYELNSDVHRAAMLTEELEKRDARLSESLDQLQLAHQAARMGTFEWNIQTGTNIWSPELETMYGLSPGTFAQTQSAWEDLIHPEDRDRARSFVQSALETGEPSEGEWRVIWPDGRDHWIFGRFQSFMDEAGKPLRLSGINIDVTERKEAEETLRKSESFNRTILSSLNTHICVLDRYGRIISVNHSWAAFALDNGLASEASVGQGVNYLDVCRRAVNDGDELARLALDGVRAVCDGTQEYFELEYPCHSPTEKRWFLMIVTPLQGSSSGAVVVHNDITESKLAAEAVRESEQRFRNMAETAPVMIWISDENQTTTFVNKPWLVLTGSTLEQELGLAWSRHVHPDDVDATVERYTGAFAKRVAFELEFRVRRKDGEYRWVFTAGTPRFSSQGEFLGYIGTAIDITERKRSENALKQAHEELKELKDHLEAENIYLQEELRQDKVFSDIVGQSDAIKYVLFKVDQVAPTDATVLITGETGTGKELVAHAIHDASQRKERPLIKVNCAALSPGLIESELFGHERGAFTGAGTRKLGRFELANTGTLLLDEIGEMPLDLQSKLLRVLQDGELERVGSGKTIKTDVRILASTNRDLKQEVQKGKFREDLWYRLNVFPITTPPLRDRRDDIPILTEHFARRFAHKFGKELIGISPETLSALSTYSWPGNVRELANVIERAVINLRGTVLKIQEDFSIRESERLAATVLTLEDMERDHIRRVLEDLNWRIDGPKGAARVLGINPSTLRFRMGKLGISKPNGRLHPKRSGQ
jgi:formate hydrogenlyase transcriptional activator